MNLHLVVALYDENISWIFHVPYHWKIFIYHKSTKLKFLDTGFNLLNHDITLIQLPNVGRESHTYLTHIVRNYDSLGDATIFCQGNPFEQCPEFLEFLQCKDLLCIMLMATKKWPINMMHNASDINNGFVPLSEILDYYDGKSLEPFDARTNRCLCKIWTKTHGHPCWPSPTRTVWGAQFAANSNCLLKYPKEWYYEMASLHNDEYYEMAWAFEKLWAELFSGESPFDREIFCKLFL